MPEASWSRNGEAYAFPAMWTKYCKPCVALPEYTGATATTHDSIRPEHIFMPLPSLPARMGDSLGPASVRPRTDKDGAGRASAGRVHADQAETPVAKKVVALPIQANKSEERRVGKEGVRKGK